MIKISQVGLVHFSYFEALNSYVSPNQHSSNIEKSVSMLLQMLLSKCILAVQLMMELHSFTMKCHLILGIQQCNNKSLNCVNRVGRLQEGRDDYLASNPAPRYYISYVTHH